MGLYILPLLWRAPVCDPDVFRSHNICSPRRPKGLYFVAGIEICGYFAELVPIVRAHQECLPIPQVHLQLVLIVVIFEYDLQRLQAMLTFDYPNFPVLDWGPIFFVGREVSPLGMTQTFYLSHFMLFMRLLICHFILCLGYISCGWIVSPSGVDIYHNCYIHNSCFFI